MGDNLCNIARYITLLTDEDRFVRKKALKSVEDYLSTNSDKESTIFSTVAENLAKTLNDPVEVNRELAVKVLKLFIDVTNDVTPVLPLLVPVLVMRLGQKEIIEHSEEIRYSTLNLLYILVNRTDEISPFLDDYISVIQKTLVDPYHEVKKLSCRIAVVLSERKCHRFYQISESILLPMLSNLTHQHSKVRLEIVVALEKVLLHSQGKLVENVIAPLTQRLFDSSSAVRRAVIELVGSWLLDLPDRYSYQTKLLPLLLSGFIDESDEIRMVATKLWHHIGLKFEKENEEQLKDKLDFDHGPPFHYPCGYKRPILGCRELVYRSASKLFPGLCKDLSDWQEATRLKAASLIPILILHLEESATQHTQHLLTGIANGLADALSRISPIGNMSLINMMPVVSFRKETSYSSSITTTDKVDIISLVVTHATSQVFSLSEVNEAIKVINQLFIAAQVLGCMISTKFWWHLLEPCLDRCTESAAPSSLAGHLLLLSGLFHGSPLNQLIITDEMKGSKRDSSLNRFSTNATDTFTNTTSTANTSDNNHSIHDDKIDENNDCQMKSGHVKETYTPINYSTLHKIIAYLSQNELISVISINAKAGLLECVQVCIKHLEEAIVLLKQEPEQQVDTLETLQLNDDSHKNIIQATYNAAKLIIQDDQIRSCLFEILLGTGATWPENDVVSSDFGRTVLSSCDKLMQRLAVCHRDCINLSRQYRLSKEKDFEVNSVPASDMDQLFFNCMPKLIYRLNEDLEKSISWNPRSIGLAILSRCLQIATGPALLFTFNDHDNNSQTKKECLRAVLDLLERGCRLNCTPGGCGGGVDNGSNNNSQFDKSPGGTDPLTLASEAELRLRGLMLLTKLTDNSQIRKVLSSPKYLNYCFPKLILPVCVWRAGRTSEAMRKAAITSYFALLASAVSMHHLSEIVLNLRTNSEINIDNWLLTNNIESMHEIMQELTNKEEVCDNNNANNGIQSFPKYSNLPSLSGSLLSLMLARLGSLLDDDLEGTRRLACLCLTVFFNGLLIPSPPISLTSSSPIELSDSNQNHYEGNRVIDFLNSPTWIQPLTTITNTASSTIKSNHESTKEYNVLLPYCPLANSFGDQVYRFYGNFIKRLNDSKDQIRLLICETINAWIRLLIPMLTSSSTTTTIKTSQQLNPVYTAVIEDFLNNLIIHLDDPNSRIRASVSRVLLRINQFASDLVIKVLNKAKLCHRSSQLCDKLLEFCHSHSQ